MVTQPQAVHAYCHGFTAEFFIPLDETIWLAYILSHTGRDWCMALENHTLLSYN